MHLGTSACPHVPAHMHMPCMLMHKQHIGAGIMPHTHVLATTYMPMHTYALLHMPLMHTIMPKHAWKCACLRPCLPARTPACMHTCMPRHPPACDRAHAHTHAHARKQTNTCLPACLPTAYTHTLSLSHHLCQRICQVTLPHVRKQHSCAAQRALEALLNNVREIVQAQVGSLGSGH